MTEQKIMKIIQTKFIVGNYESDDWIKELNEFLLDIAPEDFIDIKVTEVSNDEMVGYYSALIIYKEERDMEE